MEPNLPPSGHRASAMNRFLLVLLLALAQTAYSQTDEDIVCPINKVSGEDECFHLSPGNIAFRELEPPQIKIAGRVVPLKITPLRVLQDTKPYAELAGYKTEQTYTGKNVTLVVTKVTERNTCYRRDRKGNYVESESCCGSEVDLTFKLNDGGSTRIFHGNRWYGG